jgi:hypothetical protein
MRYYEPFAGTAAVAYALVGARRPVPYMGSKLLLSRRLIGAMGLTGQRPARILLNDAGEWGRTLSTLHAGAWRSVAAVFDTWGSERLKAFQADPIAAQELTDDRDLFDRLRQEPPPTDHVLRAATHLYLQARNYNAKPVAPTADGWRTDGFDPEHRNNKRTTSPRTNNRGWASPRWVIAERLRSLAAVDWPEVIVTQADATRLRPRVDVAYLDPPYAGTTGYPDQCEREAVIDLARRLHADGARRVHVSEGEPLDIEGWTAQPIGRPGRGRARFQGATYGEWLTSSP